MSILPFSSKIAVNFTDMKRGNCQFSVQHKFENKIFATLFAEEKDFFLPFLIFDFT